MNNMNNRCNIFVNYEMKETKLNKERNHEDETELESVRKYEKARKMKIIARNKVKKRKLYFLGKMQLKILQGGYQISSDTMLGNMASMEGKREI
jgi:hypothetical protein